MTQNEPKCPKCGQAECQRVRVRAPLLLGFAGLAVIFVVTGSVLLYLKQFLSAGWVGTLTLPVMGVVVLGVSLLWRHLFETRWRCATCRNDFRYDPVT